MLAFHGIGAYRGGRSAIALKKAMDVAISGVEICAADRPIRAFGILAYGEVTAVAAEDCYSRIDDETGERTTSNVHWCEDKECTSGNGYFMPYVPCAVATPERETIEFLSRCAARRGEKHYIEMFFRVTELRAVWVKNWASPVTQKAARILAKNRRVPCITVAGSTRISHIEHLHAGNLAGTRGFKQPTIGDIAI